jgi:CubicO group peptidase (beta-lactamase class C family)
MNRRAFVHLAAASTVVAPSLKGFAATKPAAGSIHPPDNAFVATLPHLLDLAWLPGLGMAVVGPGQPVWQHYLGVANVNTKTSITANSLFPAASLGKPIFACVVLKLAEEGAIDLDRPLNQYLQEDALTGQWGDKVTARHVLTHSTGLPNWRSQDNQKLTPVFEPGSRFQYSGEGFFHLQRVVEHITGSGFESIM